MHTIDRVSVFCGSSPGLDPIYTDHARELGRILARWGVRLVYGGGGIGLMGALARAVLGEGGRVTGVMPGHLVGADVALPDLDDLRVVESMDAREAMMAELADGFVAMAGGLGTVEELMRVVAWAQLGLHAKPVCLLNTGGYFDALLRFLDEMATAGFMAPEHRRLVVSVDEPGAVLPALGGFDVPDIDKAAWAKKANRA